MSVYKFQSAGGGARFIKVENPQKHDDAKQTQEVLKVFRETSKNDPDDTGPGELCFRIQVKTKTRNTARKNTVIFVGIGDDELFKTVLKTCTKLVGGDEQSCVFMTDDGYGIIPNQSAGNVFFKYGISLNLHVGISLRNVSWHMRR